MFCDIQDKHYPTLFDSVNYVKTSSYMAEASKILKINQIVTEHKPEVFGNTIKEVKDNLLEGTKIITKTRFPMLDKALISKFNKDSTFVIVGAETHICVLQTTIELLENNMNVVILVDGVTSYLESDRKIALEVLRSIGAYLTTSQSLIYMLMGDSNHHDFKSLLPIMKRMNGRKNIMLV